MGIRILSHYIHAPVVLLAAAEFLVCGLALFLALQLATHLSLFAWEAGSGTPLLHGLLFGLMMLVCMTAMGLYRFGLRAELAGMYARVVVAFVIAGPVVALVFHLFPSQSVGPLLMAVASTLALGGMLVTRAAFLKLVDESVFKRRVLVYGAGERVRSLTGLRRRADKRGFEVVGFVPAEGDAAGFVETQRIVSPTLPLDRYAREQRVDEVVVAMDDRRGNFPTTELLECRLRGIDVTDLTSFMERETRKVRLDVMHPSWLIFSEGFRRWPGQRLLQRLFDIVASLAILVFTWPFMLLAALAIMLEDGWPVLYRQTRVGEGGEPFQVLKFRSMRTDAETNGAVWAVKDDDRVTRVGAFLRRTRLDELPQLINILRGDMSFVGPRPERPEFVDRLATDIPFYRERHRVKPGLTGWAQLCYPYGASDRDALEKLQYDLYYIKHRSLLFDLMILLQTVEVVLWQKGAR